MEPLKKYHKGRGTIAAAELNKMVDRINWLANIRVMPPLNIEQNAFGTLVSISNSSPLMALLKTGGDSYPDASDDCNLFPATVETSASFDDSDCTNDVSATDGNNCQVYNLTGDYIPSGKYVIGLKINGTNSSGDPHYLCEYSGGSTATDLDFTLSADLAQSDSTATYTVISWNNGSDPTQGGMVTVTLDNMAASGGSYLFSGSSGSHGWATKKDDTTYIIRQMECD